MSYIMYMPICKWQIRRFNAKVTIFQVTHIQLVPPVLVMISKSPEITKEHLASVRSLVIGAAPTTAELETLAKQKLHQDVLFLNCEGFFSILVMLSLPRVWWDGLIIYL